MEERFAKILFDDEWLRKVNLPNIQYPVPFDALADISASGRVGLDQMLYWLQEFSEDHGDEWLDYEEAMVTISTRLTPYDPRPQIGILGDNWSLICGRVDLAREIITIQRMNRLVAAIQNYGDGRLLVASYRPLDSRAARFFANVSLNFNPAEPSRLILDNWDQAVESAMILGQTASSEDHGAYLTYWRNGLGQDMDMITHEHWFMQRYSLPLPPNILATQILINDAQRKLSQQ